MKKIIILGGGENQMPLIRRAKALGLYVVLCDFRNNVPGIALSDVHYQVNTLHPEEVIEVGKKEKVDGIITNSEPTFISMSKIASALSLRCLDQSLTELYKNKYRMREFCKSHGILSPAFAYCRTMDEAKSFYLSMGKKCIIKPLDNSASKGVFSINSVEELNDHFEDCLVCSSDANKAILIEEYITGTEFTVDSLMTHEGNRCLAISEKKHYEYNENVAYELLFDNRSKEYDYSLLRKTNDLLVDTTALPFGLTHAEYKFSEGQFYLIEIQARGGGNFIATDIVPFLSGIDSYTEQIKWCVKEPVHVSYDYGALSDRCSVLHFFDAPCNGGVVKAIEGLDYLESLGEKLIYQLDFMVGDTICEAKDDSSRIGWYILKCSSRQELEDTMEEINRRFKIII